MGAAFLAGKSGDMAFYRAGTNSSARENSASLSRGNVYPGETATVNVIASALILNNIPDYDKLDYIVFIPRLENTNSRPVCIARPGKDTVIEEDNTINDGRRYRYQIVARIIPPPEESPKAWELQYDIINTENDGYAIRYDTNKSAGVTYSIISYRGG